MNENLPPLWMRILGGPLPLVTFLSMDFCADWKRAKAGEKWDCLMVQWFRRGFLIPWRRRA